MLEPPLRLLVCGAGHDAIPLVTRPPPASGGARSWSTTGPASSPTERYPDAAGFVHVEAPEQAAKEAAIDERTLVVVMTHNFLRDKEYLRSLLGSDAGYIGMLGPSARTHRLLMELADEGVEITDDDRARIHGPAGLDLGPRVPRRSPRPSSPRSSPPGAAATAGSSRNARARSTTGRARHRGALKHGPRIRRHRGCRFPQSVR